MVPSIAEEIVVTADENTKQLSVSTRDKEKSPTGSETQVTGSTHQLERQEVVLSNEAIDIMDKATRSSTKTKYLCVIKKWMAYCTELNISNIATTNSFANFMAREFDHKLSYSYIKGFTAPLLDYTKDVDWVVIRKLKKGMHNLRPPKPKYCIIWDINTVLIWLSAMRTDTLMLLSQKVTTLLMILSGNRVNMLTHMKLTSMVATDEEVTFTFDAPLKHSREGKKGDIMTYRAYPDKNLCPVHAIHEYITQRGPLCGDPHLFITTKPRKGAHNAAHHDTLARWIKEVLGAAGVDTSKYAAHSCRAASTSAAALAGVSLATIIKSASWSNVGTFKTYYRKEIELHYEIEQENFGTMLLQQHTQSHQ